jgi:hypothetical protein
MPEPIIDGERWIAERLRFLREQLAGDLPADARQAVQAEVDMLAKERGIASGGLRSSRIQRWIRRKA